MELEKKELPDTFFDTTTAPLKWLTPTAPDLPSTHCSSLSQYSGSKRHPPPATLAAFRRFGRLLFASANGVDGAAASTSLWLESGEELAERAIDESEEVEVESECLACPARSSFFFLPDILRIHLERLSSRPNSLRG
jgi:hypothetical protein